MKKKFKDLKVNDSLYVMDNNIMRHQRIIEIRESEGFIDTILTIRTRSFDDESNLMILTGIDSTKSISEHHGMLVFADLKDVLGYAKNKISELQKTINGLQCVIDTYKTGFN